MNTTALHWLSPAQLTETYRRARSILVADGVFLDGDHFRYDHHQLGIRAWADEHDRRTQHAASPPARTDGTPGGPSSALATGTPSSSPSASDGSPTGRPRRRPPSDSASRRSHRRASPSTAPSGSSSTTSSSTGSPDGADPRLARPAAPLAPDGDVVGVTSRGPSRGATRAVPERRVRESVASIQARCRGGPPQHARPTRRRPGPATIQPRSSGASPIPLPRGSIARTL